MVGGSNYTAVRNPQDPNQFIVSNTFTGESYVVDPTSPSYASMNQDIKMAVTLAMTSEIAESQSGAGTQAVDTTKDSGGGATTPAATGHPSGFGSPQKLQSAKSKAGGESWDWGFATYSPSGWGTGGWHPGYAPNVWSGA